MIIVKFGSQEEMFAVVDKALDEKRCAIVSEVGVMIVENPNLAVAVFMKLAETYARFFGADLTPIMAATDCRKTNMIGFALDEPQRVFMYGISNEDFQLITHAASPDRPATKIEIN